jgi:hypothetical protein
MAIFSGDPTIRLAFSMSENKGIFAALLGSGISRSAQIPTGWEITLSLVEKAARAAGEAGQQDWAQWYVEKYGNYPNYSTLLEELGSTAAERRNLIQSYIEPSEQELAEGAKVPTKAHRAIAALVKSGHIRVIVTTNFDRLMEQALGEVGIEPTVVSSVDSLRGADTLTHSPCYLFKVHGDYKDTRILNTDAELENYPPEFNTLLDRIIDEFGLIVAGWSGEWDHALRRALLRAPSRRYPTFWLSPNGLSEHGNELAKQRSASVIRELYADAFFEGLRARVEAIHATGSLNPEGINLTIAMVKRFLSKSEYRIQLDDLLNIEIRKALDHFSATFALEENRSCRPFEECVKAYESAIEPLARVAAVLGRWGDDSELEVMQDAVKGLLDLARRDQAGMNQLVALQQYPAALVMYGYGLGLLRAGRISTLYQILDTRILIRREATKLGFELCPKYIEQGCEQAWRTLATDKRTGTPLADRLTGVLFPQWTAEFAGAQSTDRLYGLLELYSQLFSTANESSSELLKATLENQHFPSIITGRLHWSRASRQLVAHELSHEKVRGKLLAAGFARKDEGYLNTFMAGLASIR